MLQIQLQLLAFATAEEADGEKHPSFLQYKIRYGYISYMV